MFVGFYLKCCQFFENLNLVKDGLLVSLGRKSFRLFVRMVLAFGWSSDHRHFEMLKEWSLADLEVRFRSVVYHTSYFQLYLFLRHFEIDLITTAAALAVKVVSRITHSYLLMTFTVKIIHILIVVATTIEIIHITTTVIIIILQYTPLLIMF